MTSGQLIASRLVLLAMAFGFIGFGFIPVLEWLERWAKRRYPAPRRKPCVTAYAFAFACRSSEYGDPTRHRCQRSIR